MKYGCEPRGTLRQHYRRAVHGQAPCSWKIHFRPTTADTLAGVEGEDTAARYRRACSLVPRQPSEAASKTCVCIKRRSGAEKACGNAGGRQCLSHPHPPWMRQPSSKSSADRQNSTVHAAYGLCARCQVLKEPVGRRSGIVNRGARIQHRKISNVTTPRERRAN